MSVWIPASLFASLAQISDRKARAALQRCSGEGTWRGQKLLVRLSRAAGGPKGLRYEVHSDSLPVGLQERLKTHFAIVEHPAARVVDRTTAKHEWFLLVLSPALGTLPRTPERTAAIDKIIGQTLPDWKNQPRKLSRRTVERWIASYEQNGARAFVRHSRRDKSVNRVAISKAWDGAVQLDPVTRTQIADEIRKYVRGLIAADTSSTVVSTLAGFHLRELTIAAGADGAAELPDNVFQLPRRFIDAEKCYRKVAIFDRNRKAHEDAKPRVIRSREGLLPMQIVVGDVHHLDIVMRRPDGSEVWPKAVAWLDLATNRIWLDLFLLEKGEGIRNAHVIASFINTVCAAGMPQSIYLDNGSEYRWSEFVDDALQLVARIDYDSADRSSRVVRAKPYNASAKAIEGIFGILEQRYFRTLPGWAGGDRTNKRTHQVGKTTEPFPGDLAALRYAINNCLALYHITPQLGSLKGKSPAQTYEAAIASGWERIDIDTRELCTVFATDEVRTPRQGYISFAGDKWTCRELQRYHGDRVIVRAPKFDDPAVLPLLDPAKRGVIGFATRAQRYGVLDPAGAREAAEMDKTSRAGIRALRAIAPRIDPNREIARLVTSLPAPAVAPIAGTIGISDETAEIARGLAETPAERRERQREKNIKDQRRQSAALENTLRALKGE